MKPIIVCISILSSLFSFSQIEKEKEILKTLCSESYHGRGYVNDGVNIAAEFIKEEFKKAGALPIGESFFQNLKFDVNTFPAEMKVQIGNKLLFPGKDYIVAATSGSKKGELKVYEIDPFKIIAKNQKEVEKLISITKKTNFCFLLDLTKTTDNKEKNSINSLGIELSGYGPTIIKTNEKFMWSVGRFETKFPIIRIQANSVKKIKTINLNIENKFIKNFKTKNVVAKIKGENSDSCFVFTAHYDHLGRMGTATYFPGANDNASGTTMIISLADYFSKNKPKYDIYFIAFTGEEAGLVGSKYFSENPTFDLKKIKFLLNMDIMGTGDLGITVVNGTIHSAQYNSLVAINKEKNLLKTVAIRGETQNSDHYFFHKLGIKTFFIYTMGENKAYHDIFDKSETLDLNKFEELKTLYIDFILSYP